MDKKRTSIENVIQYSLKVHNDNRGSLCEIFREEWDVPNPPVQWNTVVSKKNTLRGVHCHLSHDDYLIVLSGTMLLALKDLRKKSKTYGVKDLITLSSKNLSAWFIPQGVAHGFFFPEDSIHLYGLSSYWRADIDYGCIWDDPDLGIDWPVVEPILSKRDQEAGSLKELCELLRKNSPHKY